MLMRASRLPISGWTILALAPASKISQSPLIGEPDSLIRWSRLNHEA